MSTKRVCGRVSRSWEVIARSVFLTVGALGVMTAGLFSGSCEGGRTDSDRSGLTAAKAPPSPGAIFTTEKSGRLVAENVVYQRKEDVYLNGGRGPNAPAKVMGLREGDYYFQVTDPSGKVLLSMDHISCRKFHVNERGVIDRVYEGTRYERESSREEGSELGFLPSRENLRPVGWLRDTGDLGQRAELGGVTVQLSPFRATPDPAGVYKVWITPVEGYVGAHSKRESFHGFVPRRSKTDNFRVKGDCPPPAEPPLLSVRKFHDKDMDGVKDCGEEWIEGWGVTITDPLDVANGYFTPVDVAAALSGFYGVVEDLPPKTAQTVALLDEVVQSSHPNADPLVEVCMGGPGSADRKVVFGNVGLGKVKVTKIHDLDRDGMVDPGEPVVAGVEMTLEGTDAAGEPVGPLSEVTGWDGVAVFSMLPPGNYTITETLPAGWFATGSMSKNVTVTSSLKEGPCLAGSVEEVIFTNARVGEIVAKKYYDRDGDGEVDPGEPPIEGWKMILEGTDFDGAEVGPITQYTGADGNTTFANLLPGTYTVTEVMPMGWEATGPETITLTVGSSSKCCCCPPPAGGFSEEAVFTNICYDEADFDTKGYWHNRNGLAKITRADIAFVNGLSPYSSPSSYFGAGDEPFDGYYEDGTEVVAPLAPAGTAYAEISMFLVDANAGGDPREQLAQQLLAFIFNAIHRLGGVEGALMYQGSMTPASELIEEAIEIWESGSHAERVDMSWALDRLNNDNAIRIVSEEPCEVIYEPAPCDGENGC